jgi:hypothetical protein
MKKRLAVEFFTFLIVISNISLKSQNNPFIKDGARWIYNVVSGNTNQGIQFDEKIQYKIYNDTLVENTTYKLLGTATKTTIRTTSNTTENFTCESYSLIRYDTINKLMYHKAFADTNEILLYDFNMQVGDTIKVQRLSSSFDYGPKNPISVDSIFKINIGSDSVKVFIVADTIESGQLESFIIEGFGSFTGLLWHNQKYITAGDVYFYSELVYYENDSVEFKFEPIYTSNNKIQSVNTVAVSPEIFIDCILDVNDIKHKPIKIFPNPAVYTITISTPFTENYFQFQLFDIFGNTKIQETVKGNSTNTFDVTKLSSGIYYYTMSGEPNIRQQGKILIK